MNPTAALRSALAALQGVPHVEVMDAWSWSTTHHRWVLPVRIRVESTNLDLPTLTTWYILCDGSYPAGRIKIQPAKQGGIKKTFPHQSHNGPGPDDAPWRHGDLCLNTPLRIVGRTGLDLEPTSPTARLRWHVDRALEWLRLAVEGQLQANGTHFELPQYPGAAHNVPLVAFLERPEGDAFSTPGAAGTAELVDVTPQQVVAVRAFNAGPARRHVRWGSHLQDAAPSRTRAIWARLREAPTTRPWGAPLTWGELEEVCRGQGIDPFESIGAHLDPLRDGDQHLLLLGFPIPATNGAPPRQLHWLALRLPELTRRGATNARRGFRTTLPQGRAHMDRLNHFAPNKPIDWLPTENWSPHEFWIRGGLRPEFQTTPTLLIGCGALGSSLAKTLVRMGVQEVRLIDGEDLHGANLVRHELDLDSVGRNKAVALAERLRRLCPHVEVTAEDQAFGLDDPDRFEAWDQARIIVDCTASEDVIHSLARVPWTGEKHFFSVSASAGFQHLFVYHQKGARFDETAFDKSVAPTLAQINEAGLQEFPREGAGCWHPAFPGKYDDLLSLIGRAVPVLEAAIQRPATGGKLEVIPLSPSPRIAQPSPAPLPHEE